MTLKENGVTWLRRSVLPQRSQGRDGVWRARCRCVDERAIALRASLAVRHSAIAITVHSRYNVHPDSHKSARLKFKVACIRFAEEI